MLDAQHPESIPEGAQRDVGMSCGLRRIRNLRFPSTSRPSASRAEGRFLFSRKNVLLVDELAGRKHLAHGSYMKTAARSIFIDWQNRGARARGGQTAARSAPATTGARRIGSSIRKRGIPRGCAAACGGHSYKDKM